MTSDLIFLGLLVLGGLVDFRHQRIKHWQLAVFALFILGHAAWYHDLSFFSLLNFLAVVILSLTGFLINRVGAADVKVIALSTLYNFYRFSPWWIWQVALITAVIDLLLWGGYFRHRKANSPLLFAWALAVVGLFIWWQYK